MINRHIERLALFCARAWGEIDFVSLKDISYFLISEWYEFSDDLKYLTQVEEGIYSYRSDRSEVQ